MADSPQRLIIPPMEIFETAGRASWNHHTHAATALLLSAKRHPPSHYQLQFVSSSRRPCGDRRITIGRRKKATNRSGPTSVSTGTSSIKCSPWGATTGYSIGIYQDASHTYDTRASVPPAAAATAWFPFSWCMHYLVRAKPLRYALGLQLFQSLAVRESVGLREEVAHELVVVCHRLSLQQHRALRLTVPHKIGGDDPSLQEVQTQFQTDHLERTRGEA